MKEKIRKISLLDLVLQLGVVRDSTEAKALIMAGQVIVNNQRIDKPGTLVPMDSDLRIKGQLTYVSRGGEKLAGAIADFSLAERFQSAVVLDVGSSTGGFTDCSLQHGASKIYSIDVGTNQLAWKLRQDPRVILQEKTDIRSIVACIDQDISVVVADVSFTSLTSILPSILVAAPKDGVTFLLLIKPQFELDTYLIPEGGVVVDDYLRQKAVDDVLAFLKDSGFQSPEVKDCQLPGRSGNRELFVYFKN